MKKSLMAALVLGLLVICTAGAYAQQAKSDTAAAVYTYVGAKKCIICHTKDSIGPTWLASKHAKAWEVLKPEEQKNEKCAGCHMTGKLATGEILTGVQCEACHGPGSAYQKLSVMKDKKLALANGLIMPDEKTCKKCHNENVPEQFRPKEAWDFAKMKAKGVHIIPAKKAAPAGQGK